MILNFHINSLNMNQPNCIDINNINAAIFKKIKTLTIKSGLKFNKIEKEVADEFIGSDQTAINLSIYLPLWEDDWEPYGNFEYLFSKQDYLEWKKLLCDEFSELADQFTVAEINASKRQELYRLGNLTSHFSIWRTNSLGERIKTLQKELYVNDENAHIKHASLHRKCTGG